MNKLKIGQKIVCCDGVSTIIDVHIVYQIREEKTGYIKTTKHEYVDTGYWTLVPKGATTDQIKALRSIIK